MRRITKIGFISMASSAILFASVAFAAESAMTGDSMHTSAAPSSMMMHPPAPMILTVSGDGTGRLRGVVTAVNATSLTVAAWGGVWTVTTDSNTIMLPSGSLSMIKVGDYVGVIGKVSEDAPSIAATTVRDWTTKKDAIMMHDKAMMPKDNAAMMHDKMMAPKSDGAMMHDNAMMGTSSGSMAH